MVSGGKQHGGDHSCNTKRHQLTQDKILFLCKFSPDLNLQMLSLQSVIKHLSNVKPVTPGIRCLHHGMSTMNFTYNPAKSDTQAYLRENIFFILIYQ